MGMFDFFAGNLRCPICGAVSPADGTTNMQTKIRDQPKLEDLRVGDVVPMDGVSGCYQRIKAPEEDEPVRLLECWECPSCGTARNWAEIVIHKGIITSIEAVPLDRAHLERSHFVSDDAIDEVQLRTDKPYAELFGRDLVELLRQIL
jgi:rubredoxin